MRNVILLILVCFVFGCGSLEYKPFSPYASDAALRAALQNETDIKARWQISGNFYAALTTRNYPFVENGRVHFYHWDEQGRTFFLIGDFNNWSSGGKRFKRIAGTPLLHVSLPYKAGQTIRYKYAAGKEWVHDQRNPLYESDGSGGKVSLYNSFQGNLPKWAYRKTSSGKGRLLRKEYVSSRFRNKRELFFYIPAYVDVRKRFRICFVEYALKSEYLAVYRGILDNYFAKKEYPNIVVAFIPSSRHEFPRRGYDFVDFIKLEIVPQLKYYLPKMVFFSDGRNRSILLKGRGAGFYLLSIVKGNRFVGNIYLVQPEFSYYRNLFRYFARYGKKYDYSRFQLVVSGATERIKKELAKGLSRYKLPFKLTSLPRFTADQSGYFTAFRFYVNALLQLSK